MPDMTTCTSPSCNKRYHCYRCTAKPSFRQVYIRGPMIADKCEFFIDNWISDVDNSVNDEEKEK